MIPVSIPFIAPNQKSYVNDCLDRNWISAFGKYDRKLVESFSEFVGTDYASTCSNGTVALHLALLACGVSKNDEVIIPILMVHIHFLLSPMLMQNLSSLMLMKNGHKFI